MKFGTWAEGVLQAWRMRRLGPRDAYLADQARRAGHTVVPLLGTDRKPTGTVAIVDNDQTLANMTGIDWMRAEPLERPPTWRELDDLHDQQREASRVAPQYGSVMRTELRDNIEDYGVVSATPPEPRKVF